MVHKTRSLSPTLSTGVDLKLNQREHRVRIPIFVLYALKYYSVQSTVTPHIGNHQTDIEIANDMRIHRISTQWMNAHGIKKHRRRRALGQKLYPYNIPLSLEPTSFLRKFLHPTDLYNPHVRFFSSRSLWEMAHISERDINSDGSDSLVNGRGGNEGNSNDLAFGKGPHEVVEDLCSNTLSQDEENEVCGNEGGNTKNVTVTPRTYQLEMLEESLKGNIIVAVSVC